MNEAIILKRINYEETSFILNTITKEEYLSLIVKGAKKKNSEKLALSEPITLIGFEKSKSKSMPTLTEGTILNDYKHIKSSLELITISSLMCEYVLASKDAVIDHGQVFNLLRDSLDCLEESKMEMEMVLFRFEIILLKILGSSINQEYLKDEYDASLELIDALKKIMSSDTEFDHVLIRNFFKEYYSKECGINLRSYKLYENLFN